MTRVNNGCQGRVWAGIKPSVATRGGPCDLRDHGAVYRHQRPVLCGGLPGRLHLRRWGSVPDQPRGRGPRRHGEVHRQERRLLRVGKTRTVTRGRGSGPSLYRVYLADYILRRMKDGSWQTLQRNYLYRNPWCAFRVDEVVLPNGVTIEYGVLEGDGFASVVPVTDDGKVVLVRQWRQPLNSFTLELPSGGVDEDEDPRKAAEREL